MEDFGHKVQVDQIGVDLEAQQKVMTKFQANLTKLQHENDNLNKTIEDAKLKITEAETSITANKEAQVNAQKEIDAQKALMDEIQKKMDSTKGKKPN
jgi:chromosome segregation ATPase